MKKLLVVLGCYGLMVASASAGERWSAGPCGDVAQRLARVEKRDWGSSGNRAIARLSLLLLQRDFCGVNVDAKLNSDDVAARREAAELNRPAEKPWRAPDAPRRPMLCDTTPKALGGSYTDCF